MKRNTGKDYTNQLSVKQLIDTTLEDIKSIAAHQQVADETRDNKGLITMLAISEEQTPWVFDDFIVEGDQVMIAGAPKAGKTWLALQLCIAAASGGQFLRWKASRSLKTLYINMEVGEHMWSKRLALQVGDRERALVYAHNFWCKNDTRSFDVLDPDERKKMADDIRAGGYEFVVVDVLSRCHYADENDNGVMKQVLLALRVMCGDATHVVVHHSRKPPSGMETVNLGTSSIRGASSIVGEVDMAMTLVKRGGQGARYSLQIAARNVEEPDEMLLDRDPSNMVYYEAEGEQMALSNVIQTLFKNGHSLPRGDVQQAIADGLGVSKEMGRKHAKAAVKQGLIAESRQGRNYFYYVPADSSILRSVPNDYERVKNGDNDCPF